MGRVSLEHLTADKDYNLKQVAESSVCCKQTFLKYLKAAFGENCSDRLREKQKSENLDLLSAQVRKTIKPNLEKFWEFPSR